MMLDEKERKILWVALNNLQNAGMNKMPMYRASLEPISKNGTELLTQLGIKDIIEDWIKQTVEEYELCESLKIKLC